MKETFTANREIEKNNVIQKENVNYTRKIKLCLLRMELDYIILVTQKLAAFYLVGLCSGTWTFN